LGLLLITAPFIWFQLRYNYAEGTVETLGSLENGLKFWKGLLPAFEIAGGLWLARWLLPKIQPARTAWAWTSAQGKTLTRQAWLQPVLLLFFLALTFLLSPKNLNVFVSVGLYMILALGLNITTGFTGLLVLGYASFFSFGSYVFALGDKNITGTAWWMWLLPAAILGALAGFLVGLPCLRLRGDYLAIVTLGFGESFRELLRNLGDTTGGDRGLNLSASAKIQGLPACGLNSLMVTYLVVVLCVFAAILFLQRLYHSRIGRAWIAIREDDIAAAAMGINVVRMKLLAFALSASFASVAGVLYVGHIGFIDPESCTFENSALILAMVILGGLGSIPGVLVGSALLAVIPNFLRDQIPAMADYRLLLFGVVMVVMMIFRPQGLLGSSRHRAELKAE
jgi:branched-chain amino acid transport system permease protein